MTIRPFLKIVAKSKRRVGRGHGSGRVKTAGRGTKGQKARGNVRLGFEGGQLPIIKRLPYLRGKGRNRSYNILSHALPLRKLNPLSKDSIVGLDILKKQGIIKETVMRVKIVAGGRISVPLTISLPISKGAQKAIEKAGGTVKRS